MLIGSRSDVIQVLVSVIPDDKLGSATLAETTDLTRDVGLDSLDMMQLFFELEDVFRIPFPDEVIVGAHLNVVSNLVDYVLTQSKI